MSPLRGSTTPGVPITTPRSREMLIRAPRQALAMAPCTTETGSSCPSGSTVTSAIVRPWMSATAAESRSGPTSRPAT